MYLIPKLCMLIHVNVGTSLHVRSEMNIHFTGVNEGCKVCLPWLTTVSCRLAVINENRIVASWKF